MRIYSANAGADKEIGLVNRPTHLPVLYGLYESRLRRQIKRGATPKHVGIILDGNRRWAGITGNNLHSAYIAGGLKLVEVLQWCDEAGIETVTAFLLSAENLDRISSELEDLANAVGVVVNELGGQDEWRIKHLGNSDLLPEHLSATLQRASERTSLNIGMMVNLAVGYGGRHEITVAVQRVVTDLVAQGISPDDLASGITDRSIEEYLYTSGQPDPDLVIRTSGEQRLSGFMLWQSAHSEYYFCEVLWPAFRSVDFLRALRSYSQRNRRYGR